jgi:hypothetical protein
MGNESTHKWSMINVKPGYIIYEDCFQTRAIRSFFSPGTVEVVEEYQEDGHFWKFAGSAQSIQFDMKNNETGEVVPFKELMGLLMCTGCDAACPLYSIEELGYKQNVWVYVALSHYAPDQKKNKLPLEKIDILNEFFNERIRTPEKKILIVPHHLSLPPDKCYGEMIRDVGLTEMEPESEVNLQ